MEEVEMSDAKRELTFLLAEPERRLLRAIAARLPPWVTSDRLTALGVLAATGAGLAYALSGAHPAWLWVASAMLAINWFGDSLDGTVARVRHTERPRYGYYLDHAVDAYATAAIGLGLGLSPYVSLGIALGLVVVYLALSINVYLESAVFGAFRLGYGRFGPTEVRLILIALNAGLALQAHVPALAGIPIRLVADAICAAAALGMLALLVHRFAGNLRTLARLEPLRPFAAARPALSPENGRRAPGPVGTRHATSPG
jgi:phosphatidylglycerophosphate synthase